jgi:hypothetical protein
MPARHCYFDARDAPTPPMPLIIFRHYFAAAIFDATPRHYFAIAAAISSCRYYVYYLMPLLFFIFRLLPLPRHVAAIAPRRWLLRHCRHIFLRHFFALLFTPCCRRRYLPPRRCAAAAAMLPLIFSRFRYLPIIFAFAIISPDAYAYAMTLPPLMPPCMAFACAFAASAMPPLFSLFHFDAAAATPPRRYYH